MPDNDAMLAEADLDLLREAAREAGKVALGYFRRDPRRWTKEGDSPVSEADLAVDKRLYEILTQARPDYGWLSEETADTAERLSRRRVFVVDPIDGTRAFLAGDGQWTVSIAVVEDGRPVFAAIYKPCGDEMYLAQEGRGTTMNGASVRVSQRLELSGARFAGPKAIAAHKDISSRGIDYAGYIPSLAYRLALVSDGRIDIASARGRACDWDLAAADLLVQEAGGLVTDLSGKRAVYNKAEVRHGALVAGSLPLIESLRPVLERLL